MNEGKLVNISVGKFAAADFPTASVAIIKETNANDVAVTLSWQPTLFVLDEFTNNKLMHK